MANLSLQSFTALVQNSAAAVQGACSQLLDLTVGSVLRAILEANASVALWIQWLIVQVLALTRAATSTGADLDSWAADYSFFRLPAVAATGSVTLSRLSTNISSLVVPYFNADGSINTAGALVKTADLSQSFGVTVDTTNAAWSSAQSGYVVNVGASSVNVPVQALIAAAAGNVQAGTVTVVASSIPGIDTVTNNSVFLNGADAESDQNFRARFPLYIAGLQRGTPAAVKSAVANVQQGLIYNILENQSTTGAYQPGHFVVVVNDGTGNPPLSLLNSVSAAVDTVRGLTTTFSVIAPTILNVTISLTITVAAGYVKANMIGTVVSAIQAYIDTLPIGGTLPYTKIAQVVYDSTPGIVNVSNLRVNGGTSDLTVSPTGVIVANLVTVN